MPRPTTKDLAAAAGVSLATVDRVLNGREGVRPGTVERVGAAIREIGFVRDIAAANLARRREYRFAFVLPDRNDEFVTALVRAVGTAAAAMARERIAVETRRVPADDPQGVVRALADLARDGTDGIAVMTSETPRSRDAIARAQEAGCAVVAFVSDQPSAARDRFVGIDDGDAGRTAATLVGRFCGPAPGPVLVIAETVRSRDSLDRRRGFDAVLRAQFPHLTALPTVETHGDPSRADRVVANALAGARDLRAIYLMGSAARPVIDSLDRHGAGQDVVTVAHELTPATRAGLESGRLDAVITQDVDHLVRSALRVLRSRSDGLPIVASQERIRIEILLATNLPRLDPGRPDP